MFLIDPVVKIIFGEIFRLSIGFIRVKAFAVAVILEIPVILCLLLRTDDLHIIANAAYRKQGNDNKDNRADAANWAALSIIAILGCTSDTWCGK